MCPRAHGLVPIPWTLLVLLELPEFGAVMKLQNSSRNRSLVVVKSTCSYAL